MNVFVACLGMVSGGIGCLLIIWLGWFDLV